MKIHDQVHGDNSDRTDMRADALQQYREWIRANACQTEDIPYDCPNYLPSTLSNNRFAGALATSANTALLSDFSSESLEDTRRTGGTRRGGKFCNVTSL